MIVLSGLPEAEPEYEGLDVVFRLKPVPPPELIELVRNQPRATATRQAAQRSHLRLPCESRENCRPHVTKVTWHCDASKAVSLMHSHYRACGQRLTVVRVRSTSMSEQGRRYLRFGAVITVIVVALGYLAFTGVQDSKSYYVTIKELNGMGDERL